MATCWESCSEIGHSGQWAAECVQPPQFLVCSGHGGWNKVLAMLLSCSLGTAWHLPVWAWRVEQSTGHASALFSKDCLAPARFCHPLCLQLSFSSLPKKALSSADSLPCLAFWPHEPFTPQHTAPPLAARAQVCPACFSPQEGYSGSQKTS